MNQYNLFNVIYLAFRLAPIIVVCFFLLQSLFNYDLRGVIYLVGLLIVCIVASITGEIIGSGTGTQFSIGQSYRCNTMYLGSIPITSNVIEPLSKLPLNVVVYSYTLAYMITSFTAPPVSYKNALASLQQNIPMMVIFGVLTIFEMIWLSSHNCNRFMFITIALALGVIGGVIWGYIIRSTNNASLQYMNIGNVQACSRPSKTIYRCRNLGT